MSDIAPVIEVGRDPVTQLWWWSAKVGEWRVWAKAGGGAHEAQDEDITRLGLPGVEET